MITKTHPPPLAHQTAELGIGPAPSPSAVTLTMVRPWSRLLHRADTKSAR